MTMRPDLPEREADLVVLGQQLCDLRAAMTALEIEKTNMVLAGVAQTDVVRLQKALDAAEHDLARVYQSTSWRLTAPIRKIIQLIRG